MRNVKMSVMAVLAVAGLATTASADILAYYSFDGANPWDDKSTNGRNLVTGPFNFVQLVPGQFGDGAEFSDFILDENDYLTLPLADIPAPGTGDFSYVLWYRQTGFDQGDGDGIFDAMLNVEPGYQLFYLTDGRVNARFQGGPGNFAVANSDVGVMEPDPVTNPQWHHIAYTVNRSGGNVDIKLFFDGDEIPVTIAAGDPALLIGEDITPTTDMTVGMANTKGADGTLDDIAFYDHVLSRQDINDLWNGAKTPLEITQGGGCPCDCNFDTSTGPKVCDIFDFLKFQDGFVSGDACACDRNTSTGPGVCDIFDFLDFQNGFVGGCP